MGDSDSESGGQRENSSGGNGESSLREHDRFLPIANVSRIMKKGLPANAKISKDAKQMVQECVSEFISFVTGEASDKCQRQKRKTVNGDDLLWAMATLGFEDYVEHLKTYLQRFRDLEGQKTAMAGIQHKDSGGVSMVGYDGGSGVYGSTGMMLMMGQPRGNAHATGVYSGNAGSGHSMGYLDPATRGPR